MIITNARRLKISNYSASKKFWKNFKFCHFYSSGREGLLDILQDSQFEQKYQKTTFLPSYLPEGIIEPFIRLGWDIKFYEIDEEMQPSVEHLSSLFQQSDTGVFIYIHFYGIEIDLEIIRQIVEKHNIIIIEDFSHLIRSDFRLDGDIGICSLTKLIGVPDGACVISNLVHYESKKFPLVPTNIKYKSSVLLCFLSQSFAIYNSWLARKLDSLLNLYLKPYQSLMESFMKINQMSIFSNWLMHRYPVDQMSIHQTRIDQIYLSKIKNEGLKVPRHICLSNKISFGFPVFCKDQEGFISYLEANGIVAVRLTNSWDYRSLLGDSSLISGTSKILNTHVILPNQHMTEDQANFVVELVNKWKGID